MEKGSRSVRKKRRDSKALTPSTRRNPKSLPVISRKISDFSGGGQTGYFISGAGFAYSSICDSIFFLSPVITSVMLSSRMYFFVISDTFCGVTA